MTFLVCIGGDEEFSQRMGSLTGSTSEECMAAQAYSLSHFNLRLLSRDLNAHLGETLMQSKLVQNAPLNALYAQSKPKPMRNP